MPKVIADLREKILETSKTLLLDSGYQALAVRDVAKACGIAVGTVYNYFPSKEMLAASIMLGDWLDTLEAMRRECESAAAVRDGLAALYEGIVAFSSVYRSTWKQYTFTSGTQEVYAARHRQLVNQLAGLVSGLLARFGNSESEAVCVFIAENLLTYAGDDTLRAADLFNILDRILKQKGE